VPDRALQAAWLAAAVLALATLRAQQALTVSPAHPSFRTVVLGVLPDAQSVAVGAAAGIQWTASVNPDPASDPAWVVLNGGNGPVTGTASGSFQVGVRPWMAGTKAPGTYSETVTVASANGVKATIRVTWTVVPHSPDPAFRYLSGPTGCQKTRDFPDADTCVVPEEWPSPMKPPARGEAYRDPNFGATIRVLSDPDCAHAYSTPSAISAGNSYVLVWCSNGPRVLDARTGRELYKPPAHDRSARWDARNDSFYYFMEGSRIQRVDVASHKVSTLIDYASGSRRLTSIQSGGTGDTSKDNWLPFWAPNEHQVCALDIDQLQTYCADYSRILGLPVGFIDFTLIAKGVDRPTGKRYVILVCVPSLAVFSVNQAAGRLDFEYRGPENPESKGNHDGVCDPGEKCLATPHSDTFEDSSGTQYLVWNSDTQSPCEFSLATYRINAGPKILTDVELGGGRRRIMAIDKCSGPGPWPKDDHIGCAKSSPYCVISTTYNVVKSPEDQSPVQRTPHESEVFVMRDNGAEILRLAQLRSLRFTTDGDDGYWTQSRASISNDGSLVIADTNFSQPKKVRTILIETGIKRPAQLR